jgi:hypothetical protein
MNSTSINGGIPDAVGLVLALADQTGCSILMNAMDAKKSALTANGIAVQCQNGGIVNLLGVFFYNWATAIYIPSSGSAPTINAVGMNFINNTMNVNILATNATGKLEGVNNNYTKTYINPTSSVYIVNKDSNIITVAKKGGDYTSVGTAIAAITTASATNTFIISVGPGIFFENQITMKSYVVISFILSTNKYKLYCWRF